VQLFAEKRRAVLPDQADALAALAAAQSAAARG
jgi:hypothetical protein